MAQTQAKIYRDFNLLVMKFLVESKTCFSELSCLDHELTWLEELIRKGPSELYDALKPNLSQISERIHCKERNVLSFEDSPLLNHLCVRQLFPLLVDDEEVDAFWKRLQEIVKSMGMIHSVASCAPDITNLLMSFHQKHPGVDLKDPNAKFALMQTMMKDKTFGEQLHTIFSNKDEETSIFAKLPDKLRALGLTAETKEDGGVEVEEEAEVDEDEPESGGAMLRKTLRLRKKNKPKKLNIFKKMAEVMEDKKMDAPNFEDLGGEMSKLFSGDSPDSAEFATFMQQISSGKMPDFMKGMDVDIPGGFQGMLASAMGTGGMSRTGVSTSGVSLD